MERFYWVIDDEVAGCSLPGSNLRDPDMTLADDLGWLVDQGIREVLSLTEIPLPQTDSRLQFHHVPVIDMSAPTPGQLYETVSIIQSARDQKHPVVVHCQAGLGRTGTVLAAYLVSIGQTPEHAINAIRTVCPGAIETGKQLESVLAFAEN